MTSMLTTLKTICQITLSNQVSAASRIKCTLSVKFLYHVGYLHLQKEVKPLQSQWRVSPNQVNMQQTFSNNVFLSTVKFALEKSGFFCTAWFCTFWKQLISPTILGVCLFISCYRINSLSSNDALSDHLTVLAVTMVTISQCTLFSDPFRVTMEMHSFWSSPQCMNRWHRQASHPPSRVHQTPFIYFSCFSDTIH